MKRLVSILLVFTMLLSMIPVSVFAEETDNGDCFVMEADVPEQTEGEQGSDDAVPQEGTEITEATEATGATEATEVTEATEATEAMEPETAENEGFPEYVKILPKGTEYVFSEDESSVFFPALDRRIAAGDTFVLYIGEFPAGYVAKTVTAEDGGIRVAVENAPAEIYENVDLSIDLDVRDGMIIEKNDPNVTTRVEGDSIVITGDTEAEVSGQGKLTVVLSNFKLNLRPNETPTASFDYSVDVGGTFEGEFEHDLPAIRFLGVGTFDFTGFVVATADLEMSFSGNFIFKLLPGSDEEGAITEVKPAAEPKFDGSGEVKIGLEVAAGFDFLVGQINVVEGTVGVAGEIEKEEVTEEGNEHTHTDLRCYIFMTVGTVLGDAGLNIPVKAWRICTLKCGEPENDPEFTFESAVQSDEFFVVDTSGLEEILKVLPRMLCGNQTIESNEVIAESVTVEYGTTLTIAENRTLTIQSDLEQRGQIVLEKGATLSVLGNFLHEEGTLELGEAAKLHVGGDYTIKSNENNVKFDGELRLEITGNKVEIEDDEIDLNDEPGSIQLWMKLPMLKCTELRMGPDSSVMIDGNLYQNGGEIIGGDYEKACTLTVGKEGSETGGCYVQTGGSLDLSQAFFVTINRNYVLSGGKVYFYVYQHGQGALVDIGGNYEQSGNSSATFSCDVTVNGNVKLTENAVMGLNSGTTTIGKSLSQKGESVIGASLNSTVQFINGRTHNIDFETPENSRLGTLICQNPREDQLNVLNGIPAFYLGSDVETVDDLRIVVGQKHYGTMQFQGNSLTVHGDLIQDGASSGNGEAIQIVTDGDYILTGGYLQSNGGSLSVGGDFRMLGYDPVAKQVLATEPSVGGASFDETAVTVGGTVEVFCITDSGLDGFYYHGDTGKDCLFIGGDLIQRAVAGSDPYVNPFELHNTCKLIFNGEDGPQTVSFETAPKITGKDISVINRNPAGIIWGDNTDALQELFQRYGIAFDPNSESATGTMNPMTGLDFAVPYTLPKNAYKLAGHTFSSWNTNADGSGTSYADGASVTGLTAEAGSVVTLYAQWEPYSGKFNIVFNANGGTGTTEAMKGLAGGKKHTLTANQFKKTGYHFAGWALEPEGPAVFANRAKVSSKELCMEGKTATLYAVWEPNSYKVTFNGAGGSYIPEGKTKAATTYTQTLSYDTPAVLESNRFAYKGYTFSGWNTKANGKGKSYEAGAQVLNLASANNGSFDLYAQWSANPYTVRFHSNYQNGGEEATAEQSYVYGKAAKLVAHTFVKTGYRFLGWSTTPDGAKNYDDRESVKNLASETGAVVDLYAVWKLNTYSVKFQTNGAKGTVPVTQKGLAYGVSQLILPECGLNFAGYVFAGWNTKANGTGTMYQPGEAVDIVVETNNATITLYAAWTYDVTLMPGTAEGSSASVQLYRNRAVQIENPGYEKSGYRFAGWNTNANRASQGTVQYAAEDSLKNIGVGKTLYAVWKPVTYKITYHAANGTEKTHNQTMTWDKAEALAENPFTWKGHKFLGWATEEGGSVVYTDKDNNGKVPFNFCAEKGAVFHLYAVWN